MDIITIVIIIVVAAVFYLFYRLNYSGEATMAEIIHDGQVVKTVALNKDDEFRLSVNSQVRFKIESDAIRFQSSNCLDQVCVNSGYLREQAHFAACLPNKLVLRILGEPSEDEPDIIAQ